MLHCNTHWCFLFWERRSLWLILWAGSSWHLICGLSIWHLQTGSNKKHVTCRNMVAVTLWGLKVIFEQVYKQILSGSKISWTLFSVHHKPKTYASNSPFTDRETEQGAFIFTLLLAWLWLCWHLSCGRLNGLTLPLDGEEFNLNNK